MAPELGAGAVAPSGPHHYLGIPASKTGLLFAFLCLVCGYTGMCLIYVGGKDNIECLPQSYFLYLISLKQALIEPGTHQLSGLAAQQGPGIHLSRPPQHWGLQACDAMPSMFLYGFWGSELKFLSN